DRHPQLIAEYFRNYRRVVYLVQERANSDVEHARAIAARLGLEFEVHTVGYGQLESSLRQVAVPAAAAAPAEVRVAWPR
ncbi:MAG: DUF1638 domain-containing protein, partial [Proteobacteria bacterium]|nr:DUF1638 domain-containing protein [Pseudomonadota bacterium]